MISIPETTLDVLTLQQIDEIEKNFLARITYLEFIPASTGNITDSRWRVEALRGFDVEKLARILGCTPFDIIVNPAEKELTMKPPMQLLPFDALIGVAYIQDFGINKHGENSWREDRYTVEYYLGAALRHIGKHLSGVLYDESGFLNLAHAAADILFALAKLLGKKKLHKNKKSLLDEIKEESNASK